MVLASESQRCWASGRRGVARVVETSVPFLRPEQGSFSPALPGVGFGAAKTLTLAWPATDPGAAETLLPGPHGPWFTLV